MHRRRLLPVATFLAGALVAAVVGWYAFGRDDGHRVAGGGDPATGIAANAGPTTTYRPGDYLPTDAPAYELCLALHRLSQLDSERGPDVEAQRRAAWERAYQYAAGSVAVDVKMVLDDYTTEIKPATFDARRRVALYYAEHCRVTIDPPTTTIRRATTTLPAMDTLPLDLS